MTNPDFRPTPGVDGLAGINRAQRLYVIPAGDGVSCYGFDNAHRLTEYAAERTGRPELQPPKRRGTVRAFRAYRAASSALAAFYRANPGETHFDPGTPEAVRRVLDQLRGTPRRVRIWCGDATTGRAWAEENDVCGTIGRSMGPFKSPLLIASARATGGPAILTACIVGIQDDAGAWLYRHPSFSVGAWRVEGCRITHDGETYANMATPEKAERLAAFMRGDRFTN